MKKMNGKAHFVQKSVILNRAENHWFTMQSISIHEKRIDAKYALKQTCLNGINGKAR